MVALFYLSVFGNDLFKNELRNQMMSCELGSEPSLCVKAAQISLKEYQSMQTNPYDNYEEYRAGMYYNAGVKYNKIEDTTNACKIFKKAVEFSPNYSDANYNLGICYYFGDGVGINKIKAYEHFRVAAQQGNQNAQKNLDIICKESPWACK